MRKLHVFASALIVVFLVASCGISGNGFGGNSIQKRKYTKGFYFNKNRHYHGQENEVTNQESSGLTEDVATRSAEETVTPLQLRTVPNQIADQQTIENGKQPQPQQRQEEKKKKTATQARKEMKTVPTTRQRKPREHEFYIPMKEHSKSFTKAAASSSDTGMLILLVILALIIPPLAVFIYEGATSRFWIDLILAIIGYGIGFWLLGGLGWLCALAAVIYALLIVLEVI